MINNILIFVCSLLLIIINNIGYANNAKKDYCKSVYNACIKDTGLPADQVLMGLRGICQDQQTLCKQVTAKFKLCVKDYGLKACNKIYNRN